MTITMFSALKSCYSLLQNLIFTQIEQFFFFFSIFFTPPASKPQTFRPAQYHFLKILQDSYEFVLYPSLILLFLMPSLLFLFRHFHLFYVCECFNIQEFGLPRDAKRVLMLVVFNLFCLSSYSSTSLPTLIHPNSFQPLPPAVGRRGRRLVREGTQVFLLLSACQDHSVPWGKSKIHFRISSTSSHQTTSTATKGTSREQSSFLEPLSLSGV